MRKPLGIKYLENPATIGEKLRNKRLELNLLQKDVASKIGTSEETIINWENNLSEPHIVHLPKIINFLGYSPHIFDTQTLPGKIKEYRYRNGLNLKKMGVLLNVDASTIGSWERNKNSPQNKKLRKLVELFADRSIQ